MPATPALPRPSRSTRRALRSLLWRYRPALIACLVAIAAWATIGALMPAPPATSFVLAAVRDLPAGHLLEPADLTQLALPLRAVPPAALTDPVTTAGARLAQPVASGVPLTSTTLVGESGWGDLADGELLVPVRLADPAVAALLPTSATIHLVSATGSGSTLLTSQARLIAPVASPAEATMLGQGDTTGPLLLLAVPAEVASLVLDASAGGTLTVALAGGGGSPHPPTHQEIP